MAQTQKAAARVDRTDRDGTAILTLQNPPSNALDMDLVSACMQVFQAAEADPAVEAIVLTGAGRSFAISASVAPASSNEALFLQDLCNRIEGCSKPVVAALQGAALGAGLELALAAHFRVAHKAANLGFPDVSQGLMPGGGGTQRMPRLAGAGLTLEMMLGGRRLAAGHADAKRIIDGHTQGAAVDAALVLLQKAREEGIDPPRSLARRIGLRDPVEYQAQIDAYRKALGHAYDPARPEILRAVEAALLLPPEAGLALEAEAYEACLKSPSAKALRYLAEAERIAASPAQPQDPPPTQVALAGDGVDVVALAANALDRGFAVCHFAPSEEAAGVVKTALTTALDKAVETFRLSRSERRTRLERFVSAVEPAAVAGCDVIIGCGASQSALLTQIDPHAGKGPSLATTQLFSLVEKGPFLGLSLESDARLAEIMYSEASRPADVVRLAFLMQRLGWQGVQEKSDTPVSRLLQQDRDAMLSTLAALGARPKQVASVAARMGLKWAEPHGAVNTANSLSDTDVRRFIRSAMASRGMAYVRSQILTRISDMDVLATRVLGYSRATGGPMHLAQSRGLLALDRDIKKFHDAAPDLVSHDPALDDLIKTGQGWAAFE